MAVSCARPDLRATNRLTFPVALRSIDPSRVGRDNVDDKIYTTPQPEVAAAACPFLASRFARIQTSGQMHTIPVTICSADKRRAGGKTAATVAANSLDFSHEQVRLIAVHHVSLRVFVTSNLCTRYEIDPKFPPDCVCVWRSALVLKGEDANFHVSQHTQTHRNTHIQTRQLTIASDRFFPTGVRYVSVENFRLLIKKNPPTGGKL